MNIDLRKIIPKIVESMLPKFSGKNAGLLFQISTTFEYGKDDRVKKEKKIEIFILFHRPNNYTKVMYYIPKVNLGGHASYREVSEGQKVWILTSDHDSCWRDDGLRFLYKIEQENSVDLRSNKFMRCRVDIWDKIKYVDVDIIKEFDTFKECKVIILREIEPHELSGMLKNER